MSGGSAGRIAARRGGRAESSVPSPSSGCPYQVRPRTRILDAFSCHRPCRWRTGRGDASRNSRPVQGSRRSLEHITNIFRRRSRPGRVCRQASPSKGRASEIDAGTISGHSIAPIIYIDQCFMFHNEGYANQVSPFWRPQPNKLFMIISTAPPRGPLVPLDHFSFRLAARRYDADLRIQAVRRCVRAA